jgi:hypothetical protein
MDIVTFTLAVPLVGLQALLCFLLLRDFQKPYFILILYSGVQLATSALELAIYFNGSNLNSTLYTRIYWSDEILLDLLLFLLVIVLTFQATEGSPIRPAVGKLLAVVVCLALVLPFVILHPPLFKVRWFNGTSQMLNFGGAIMNLALWTALIGSKRRDSRLLTVSAGLGVMVTGAAITWGVRQWVTPHAIAQVVVNKFGLLMQIAATAIWCWAFRRTERRSPSSPVAAATNNIQL